VVPWRVDHDAGFGSAVVRPAAAVGAEPKRFARGSDELLATGFAPALPVESPVVASEERTAEVVVGVATAGRGFVDERLVLLLDDCVRAGAAAVTRMLAVTGCGVRSRATTCEAADDAEADSDSLADAVSDELVSDEDVSAELVSEDFVLLSAADSCLAFDVHPVDPAAQAVASTNDRESDCFI
jgi:hypothetical protein